ncbi:hypothetical protein LL946_08700 [Knoellia locipacati]|uniref:hypothetical protein n=1 Tax=Knoellia locipacati TaxID=882824 RepID=UPI00384F381E
MAATKIQDEAEVVRWIQEGKTYQWMTDEYRRKYNIDTVPSLWSNFRRRKGLTRRIARNDDLIPWAVRPEHRWAYPLAMLRVEARIRAGLTLRSVDEQRLAMWHINLAEADAVVHYDPDTVDGWHYVPRRDGIDVDLIRVPERKTSTRLNGDGRN